jgi:hypothetical protein
MAHDDASEAKENELGRQGPGAEYLGRGLYCWV